jgi:hypothetical protein
MKLKRLFGFLSGSEANDRRRLLSDWVAIEPNSVDPLKQEKLGRVTIAYRMSPFDVPRAMRAEYDAVTENYILEFKYLAAEPLNVKHQGPVTLELGKNSGRLYKMGVHQPSQGANLINEEALATALEAGFRTLQSDTQTDLPHVSYEAAREAFRRNKDSVLAPLALVAG